MREKMKAKMKKKVRDEMQESMHEREDESTCGDPSARVSHGAHPALQLEFLK